MHVAILNIIQLLHVLRAAAQRASFTQIHGFLHSSLVCLSSSPPGRRDPGKIEVSRVRRDFSVLKHLAATASSMSPHCPDEVRRDAHLHRLTPRRSKMLKIPMVSIPFWVDILTSPL